MRQTSVTPLSSTTPVAETVGTVGAVGVGSTAARADHAHALLGSSPQAAQLLAAAAAAGASGAPSRFDHVHQLGVADLVLNPGFSQASSTAFSNCVGWSFPIAANETWDFEVRGYFTLTAAAGLQVDVTGPAGTSSVDLLVAGWQNNPGAIAHVTALSTAMRADNGIDAAGIFTLRGRVANGATPGTIQVRAAQVASNINPTTIAIQSSGIAIRKV